MNLRFAAYFSILIFPLAGITPAEPTVTITRTLGVEVVETRVVTLNHLGQPDGTSAVGPGMAAVDVDPEFRADGTLASISLSIGGVTSRIDFEPDGTVGTLRIPNRQDPGGPDEILPVDHEFVGGEETFQVDGTTASRALDGTAVSLTGAGVMDRGRSTGVALAGYEETVDPAEGASTVLASNAAGAKTLHDYAAGADTQTTWLAGGLLESRSLGRGGSAVFGYSADGARDLESIAWPGVASEGFVAEPLSGGTILLGRDAAGNIDSITDPSGERDLDHEKNRLTKTDWLAGELNPYKIVRAHDTIGRLETVTLTREG
ncbi:hypothetical protein, partial [Haloferula sp. A504]|uniref:hypothetical protein n=1 Tax=Haloferula sp. A504 TaxID=3373601 RepID=UPI0031BCC2DC|nr:hypothetical protein [Verrucomicrobiaceae bacterium E54]